MLPGSNKTNEDWLARLKKVECGDATYAAHNPSLVFDRAKGSKVWDVAGNSYIDLCAGFGALPLGHAPSELSSLFVSYSEEPPEVLHAMGDVYASRAKIELLEALISTVSKTSPQLTKAALALTGGQAVEIALKTAFLCTQKKGIICFKGGYHGLDFGVLPVTSRATFRSPFSHWIKEENVKRLDFGCSVKEIVAAIHGQKDLGTAAIIVEPIQGRAGVIVPPMGWLAQVREVCNQYGILLVFDEIFTGLGRVGKLSHTGEVVADLLCLGKALGGGFPLSACIGTKAAMEAWPDSEGEALHTGTFFGHPFACRAGLLTLKGIVSQDLAGRAHKLGKQVYTRLSELFGPHPGVWEVRGQGLMLGVAFREPGMGVRLMDAARGAGIIALASGDEGEVLAITPALNMPNDMLLEAVEKLHEVYLRIAG